MGLRSLLPAVLLPLAAALCAAQAREGLFEARARVGGLLPGRYECSILGIGDTLETEPGLLAGLDLLLRPASSLSIGVGGEYRAPRSLSGSEGSVGLLPLYGAFRLAFPLPHCAVYLCGRLGWAGFLGDEELTGTFGRLTGGLFYCAGLGAELRLRRLGRGGGALFLEAAYSAASGALTDDIVDYRADLRVHGLELAAGLAKGF